MTQSLTGVYNQFFIVYCVNITTHQISLVPRRMLVRAVTFSLVRIREAPHTTHHAEHVVVRRIHAHLGARRRAHRVVGHRQQQRRVVNAGQVARAAGLVLLRGEREGIHVDAHRRHVRVVLVGLHQVKVVTLTHREAVVAVELDERRHHGVLARHALNTCD